jgi:hypothetical protein
VVLPVPRGPSRKNEPESAQARIARDPAYRQQLLREGVECLLSGDLDTGKAILRDYINATMPGRSAGVAGRL